MATTKVNVSKISDFPKVTPAGTDQILVEKDGQGGSITLSQIPVSTPVNDKISEEVNKLNSQINDLAFLPEGSSVADAELINIRTPADGFTVPAGSNAGNAVRAQVTQLDEKISNLKGDLDDLHLMPYYKEETLLPTWESGYILSGEDKASEYGIRINGFYDFSDVNPSVDVGESYSFKLEESVKNDYKVNVVKYDSNGNYVANFGERTGDEFNNWDLMNIMGETLKVRVYLTRTDNQPFTDIPNANNILIVKKKIHHDGHIKDTEEFKDKIKSDIFNTLYGKKWCVIGDSITEANNTCTNRYHDLLKTKHGMTIQNKGESGTGYYVTRPFYNRVGSIDSDVDIITVFGGINDCILSNVEIGEVTDTQNTTLCGCVNILIDVLENKFKERVPLGFISSLPAEVVTDYFTDIVNPSQHPSDLTCRMSIFMDKLEQICKLRGYPFLDLYHSSGFRPWVTECNNKYFKRESFATGDGLHPNDNGHKILANKIENFLIGLAND